MTQISRRRLAVGAAWTVPVLVVGAAAPAFAASPGLCLSVTGEAVAGSATPLTVDVTVELVGYVSGDYALNITGISGADFAEPLGTVLMSSATTTVTFTRPPILPSSGTVIVEYSLLPLPGVISCTADTFTFEYLPPG